MSLPIPFGWFTLGFSDELPPGAVKPVYCFDEHLVLFRTEDGAAHLMEAFCPHLGAHLGHGGKVRGDSLACPFHGWEFDGAGNCTNIPYASAIPKRAAGGPCLHSYPLRECNRMIWAWYHPRRLPPLWECEDYPELSDPDHFEIDCYEWEIETSLQEACENSVDTAHFATVHGTDNVTNARVTLDGYHKETELTVQTPAFDDDGTIDFSRKEEVHLLSRNSGPGMSRQSFSRTLSTLMFAANAPITATRMKMHFIFATPLDLPESRKMLAKGAVAEIVHQVGQDIPIWENKAYVSSPILCDGDGPIAKFRRWFAQFYVEAPEQRERAQPVRAPEARCELAAVNH